MEKKIRQKKERKALERVSCVVAHYTYPAFFSRVVPHLVPFSYDRASVDMCLLGQKKKKWTKNSKRFSPAAAAADTAL